MQYPVLGERNHSDRERNWLRLGSMPPNIAPPLGGCQWVPVCWNVVFLALGRNLAIIGMPIQCGHYRTYSLSLFCSGHLRLGGFSLLSKYFTGFASRLLSMFGQCPKKDVQFCHGRGITLWHGRKVVLCGSPSDRARHTAGDCWKWYIAGRGLGSAPGRNA